jgi:tetratricopeptide (TPR) repeat protein
MAGDDGDAVTQLREILVAYGRTADPGLLDRAINFSENAASNTGFSGLPSAQVAAFWSLGGAARIYRSRLNDDGGGLDDAIGWCRRALGAAADTDPNRPAYASNLATILAERYDHGKERADLDEVLALFEWAVPAIRATGQNVPVALHNQGQALLELYGADHDLAVLSRAIGVLRKAVADTAQPRLVIGGYLTTLGQALRAKAEAVSDPAALDEAVQILHRAVEQTSDSDDHVAALVSLGNALLDRSEMGRGGLDLADSVSCLEQALDLVHPGTPRWGRLASNLGNALLAQFRATGQRTSLVRSRDLFRAATQTFDSPSDREVCLSNLTACLQELYEQTGELDFLDEAIGVFRVTAGRSTGAAGAERLQNYGVTLLARFKRYQSPDDLDQAISQFRAAARVSPPGSVSRAAATNSLGNALFARYDLLGRDADMDAAIRAHEEAVHNARKGSVDRAMYQSNLGVSLMLRGQQGDSAGDIDAAIREQESAVADVPHDSQEYIKVVAGLADSLATRAAMTRSGPDAERAQALYRRATVSGLDRLPEQAIGSGRSWGTWAAARNAFAEAAEAFGYALEAVQRLFSTQLTRPHKEAWLRDAQGISVQAAYALAMTGDTERAVEAFEHGRALLLSEALQQDRADLERLAGAGRPDLTDRYEAAVARWNQLSRDAAAAASGLREARAELDAVIGQVRAVPSYQRFLLPPTFADVLAGAGADPLAYLGATESGGLALVVLPAGGSAAVAWLPALTDDAVAGKIQAYRRAYQAHQQAARSGNYEASWESAIDEVTAWTWDAVMAPLLAALAGTPRATLVPAGLLGVLPLHAAWTPDPAFPAGRRYALDEIVLTYAPNAQAVGAARNLAAGIQGERMIAVDEPDLGAAGAGLRLPFSAIEVAAAAATFSESEVVSGPEATAERVLAALSHAQFFHLSCHGRADPASPLDSALAMTGGQPLTLRDILGRRLRARVGVLSACETAIPGDELPDEVVALPTGLIQVGVATAVASLWSVPGAATALLMFRFYERWRVGGIDPGRALRDAQQWLRDTDSGEKMSYFEEIALDDGHPMAGAAQEPYEMLFRITDDPARRDCQNPYYWAAFACFGA